MSLGHDARRPGSGRVASIACLSLGVASLGMASPAHAQVGTIQGGSGGHYYEYSCGPGRVLVGLRGSAGVLLDSIQPICATVEIRNMTFQPTYGPVIGSDRPIDNTVECPARYAVTSALMGMNDDHPQLGAIRIICTELVNRENGGTRDFMIAGSGNLEGYSSPLLWNSSDPGRTSLWSNCPGGYATGIRGRSDRYVDAFGLMCGPKPAGVDLNANAGHTLGKRKKRADAAGPRDPNDSTSVSIPGAQHTLGKRKRRVAEPTGGAGSETNPNPMLEQPGGPSIFTDSFTPPPPPPNEPAAPVPPSPLINGTYATRLTVNDSRCIQGNLRGSWQRDIALSPQPGILIPLNQFNSMFAGPVMLQVQGLVLSQSTSIPVNFGVVADAPAKFDGAFSNDGSSFDVRFEAGNSLCRIAGTLSGKRL